MKIGILGLGSIGMRHAKNLMAMGRHISSAMIPSVERMQLFKQAGGEDAPEEMIYYDCDAVVIASPSECHWGQVLKCMDASKHIFVEKPIATEEVSNPGCIEGGLTCSGKVIMVGCNLPFSWLRDKSQGMANTRPHRQTIMGSIHLCSIF